MKKILVIMLAVVLCMSVLTGCSSNTGNTDVIGSSDAVEENTESSIENASVGTETDMADTENATASEEESEITEETVMFSADEVMAHIDTLIAQYTYNNPEHIKALVIAANLDYISEEDLDTILTTYGYAMEELGVLYDECILDNAAALNESYKYSQGQIDTLSEEDTYEYRITIEAAMLNKTDAENVKWYDEMLVVRSQGKVGNTEDIVQFRQLVMSLTDNNLSTFERVCYSYAWGILYNELTYAEYLDNPFTAYNR